ncbi:MAG: DUF1080 domain-containing protein [Pseudomonadota bacterium]
MKIRYLLVPLALVLCTQLLSSCVTDNEKISHPEKIANGEKIATENWRYLLDKDLSQWNTYLGFPLPETKISSLPKDAKGNYTQPIGHGKDERSVFSLSEIDGEPVLHISGEIYGSIYTQEEFENYHLVLQFKWGNKKWQPRLDLELDTGVLYHGVGEHGVDYWKAWPLSQELQIIEQGVGDWWQIAGSQIDIRCEKPAGEKFPMYAPTAKSVAYGSAGAGITCRRGVDVEKSKGEWNTVELITYGDKSLHIVNGVVVMALSNSHYTRDGKKIPLTKGKILLQSEAAEVFYKNIKLKSIVAIPAQYEAYFQ